MANQLSTGPLPPAPYAVERLAVATFVRLWDALDRRLFTSDPSPWNVLVHQPDDTPGSQSVATIIDLHGLEDDVSLAYVVQRLAAVYGMRQDILEDVLIPGVLDALGVAAGTALLQAELPQFEAEAARMRQNLGVDMQQPLLQLPPRAGLTLFLWPLNQPLQRQAQPFLQRLPGCRSGPPAPPRYRPLTR